MAIISKLVKKCKDNLYRNKFQVCVIIFSPLTFMANAWFKKKTGRENRIVQNHIEIESELKEKL